MLLAAFGRMRTARRSVPATNTERTMHEGRRDIWWTASGTTTLVVLFAALLVWPARETRAADATSPASTASISSIGKADDFGLDQVRLINDGIRARLGRSRPGPFEAGRRWRVVPPRVSRPDRPRAEGRRARRVPEGHAARQAAAAWSTGLLGDEYADEYARNWTTVWTNLLIGRTGGMDRKSLVSRPGMEKYLREALQVQQAVRPDGDAS